MWLIDCLYDFQRFSDEIGYNSHLRGFDLKIETISFVGYYFRKVYVVLLVGSIIGGILLPFKLLLSIWVKKNRNYNI